MRPDLKFIFDFDGTLTCFETLPLVAEQFGVECDMRRLTARAVNGLDSFEESFRARVAMLAAIPPGDIAEFVEASELRTGLVEFIRSHKERCMVLTSNLDCWCSPALESLGCCFQCSKATVEGSRIEGIAEILDKAEAVEKNSPSVYVGDGENDREAMLAADIAVLARFTGVEPSEKLMAAADYYCQTEEEVLKVIESLL